MRCIQGLVACAIEASRDPPYTACNHSGKEAKRFFNCRLLFVGFLLSLSCSSFFRMTFTFCLKIVKKISHFAQLDFFRQIAMLKNLVTLNAFEAKVKAQFPVVQVHYKSPSVIHVHWPTYLFPPE